MASINEILGKNIDSVKALRAEIKSLQDSLVGLDAESQEFKDTSAKLTAAQDELTKVTRAGKEENNAAKDSIIGMKNEYKALYDQYKLLTEEQRNSDFGKNMAASLETLSTKINETQKGVGSFKDNIGNYAGSITDAFSKMGVSVGALQGPLKAATTGFKGLNATMAANPIGAVIAVIVALIAIFAKVKAAISENEQLQMRFNQAMAAFKPIADAVANVLDWLAEKLVKLVEWTAKAGETVLSLIPGYKKAAQSHKELAKATNDLTLKQRELSKENSKKEAEIEKLREQASATEDAAEKTRLLQEAKEKQAEVDQANIEIAQEELRIAEEYAAKTANSAEANDKLAAAQVKVNNAVAQGEKNMRMYNKQLDAAQNTNKSSGGSGGGGGKSVWQEEKEELDKFMKDLEESQKTRVQKTTETYNRLLALAKKHGQDVGKIETSFRAELTKAQKEDDDERRTAVSNRLQQETAFYQQYYNNLMLTAKDEEERAIYSLQVAENTKKRFDELMTGIQSIPFEQFSAEWKTSLVDLVQSMNDELNLDIKFPPDINEDNWDAFESNLNAFGKLVKKNYEEVDNDLKRIQDAAFRGYEESTKLYEKQLNELDESFAAGSLNFDEYNLKLAEIQAQHLQTTIDYQKQLLDSDILTADQRLEVEAAYYDNLAKMREADYNAAVLNNQRRADLVKAAAGHFDAWNDSLSNILGLWGNITQAQIDNGNLDEKETKKKQKRLKNLEKAQLAISIAMIASQTAQGIMSVWEGYAAELPINAETAAATGPAAAATKAALDAKSLAAAFLRTGMIAAQGTAQVAAAVGGYISKNSASGGDSGSSGGGVGATPTVIDSTPYSYTRTVQTQEDEDYLNQHPVYVTVTDIEEGLGQKVKVTNESSF